MPDPAETPAAPEADLSVESFFQKAATMADVAPVPEVAPAQPAAPVQIIETSPAAAPAPAASPAPAVPAPVAQPAATDPNALNPDAPRNYRIQAQDAIEQRTLQLRAQDRSLTLPQALEKAYQELGLPAPFAQTLAPSANPAAPEPAAAAEEPADPLEQIEASISERETALQDLNPALDAAEWNKINAEIRKLEREAARMEAERAATARLESATAENTLAQIEQTLHQEFKILNDPAHPFTLAFEAERNRIYQTGTDEQLNDPALEINIARQLADTFQQRYGMPVRPTQVSSPAATTPQALNANVTQPTAPPAVAHAPVAQPRSAAAPLSGAPASVNPVTGITPPNPQEGFQSMLRSDGPLNADAAADAMLNGFFGGQGAPSFPNGRLVAA
jgi:hypothetical protein